MKIATWNVNSVGARLPHLMRWIQEDAPDVALLQEIKCVSEAFPYETIEDMGYNVVAFGQKSYNGVAILSKFPLEDVTRGLPTFEQDTQARYIEAVTNGVRVASIYVPNGSEVGSDKFSYKMAFYGALGDHAAQSLSYGEPLVWGGDYNVAPYAQDMHDPALSGEPRILCSVEEQRALRTLISQGFCDGLRQVFPATQEAGKGLFSWWDYRAGSFNRNKGFRIDHLLLSPQASDRLEAAGIDAHTRGWERPSDHAPVWITLV
ncbi:MAG: exodeoxyribonuclease III [Candidatus Puniceispirillum sp.]|nr:exodeoxyribonuclease III [Candidatus Puniceispirillum sp.]